MRLSITTKIFLFVILPILMVFGAASYINIVNINEYSRAQISEKMKQITWRFSGVINSELNNVIQSSKTVKYYLENTKRYNTDDILKVLSDEISASRITYSAAVLFDKYSFSYKERYIAPYVYKSNDGLRTGDLSRLKDKYYSKKWDVWIIPQKLDSAFWSSPYLDTKGSATKIVSYASPFYSKGKFAGVILFDIPISAFGDLLDKKYTYRYDFLIVNDRSDFIFHPFAETDGSDAQTASKEKLSSKDLNIVSSYLILDVEGNIQLTTEKTKESCRIYFSPVKNAHWNFASIIFDKDILRLTNYAIQQTLIILLIVFIIILIVILFITKNIIKPIKALDSSAKLAAGGKLKKFPKLKNRDEIGELASSFQALLNKIGEREAALKQSESNFKMIYNTSPVIQFTTDKNNNVIRISNYALHSLGYSKGEILGNKFYKIFAGQERPRIQKNIVPALCKYKILFNEKIQMVKRNGDYLTGILSATIKENSAGEFDGGLWIITETK